MRSVRVTLALGLFTAALLTGCGAADGPQPPAILFGVHECEECRMIISDERYAAGLAIDDEGRFRSLAFDDIGCMLMHERAHDSQRVAARYARDATTGEWLAAETAAYLFSPRLQTPMAFGVAAGASRESLASLHAAHAGEVFDFDELRRRAAEGTLTLSTFPQGGAP
jgi:copper chaperone NosL